MNEIFGSVTQEPFAGLTIIAAGDFFQLPLVGDRPVYSFDRNTLRNFDSLWKRFRVFELNEVIRQPGESQLIDLLNSVCTTDAKPSDVELLASTVISSYHEDYPYDALHIFAENANVRQHKLERFQSVRNRFYSIAVVDKLPANVSEQKIKGVLNRLSK